MQDHYSINELCPALAVSRSGYHDWAARVPGVRAQANTTLLPLIAQAHQDSRQTYGSPRITHWLRQRGHRCGRVRMARLMRHLGLSHRPRRRLRPLSLTDSNHDCPVAPNLLAQRTPTLQPDTVWVADLTYVPTDEGWLYMAGVLDRCTRRCIGWAFAETLATTLPLAALEMALSQRQPPAGLVPHSDRGVQYASAAYRQRLAQSGRHPEHEPARQLLRPRAHGKLLEHTQMQSGPSHSLCHPRDRASGHLRMDRSLLQPDAVPQRARLPVPGGL